MSPKETRGTLRLVKIAIRVSLFHSAQSKDVILLKNLSDVIYNNSHN